MVFDEELAAGQFLHVAPEAMCEAGVEFPLWIANQNALKEGGAMRVGLEEHRFSTANPALYSITIGPSPNGRRLKGHAVLEIRLTAAHQARRISRAASAARVKIVQTERVAEVAKSRTTGAKIRSFCAEMRLSTS